MPTSARWEVTSLLRISVKTLHPAGRSRAPPYQPFASKQPRPVWAWLFWLFKLECAGVELVISALLGNQVVVRAAFNDAAMVEHHDRVGVLHR